MPLVRPHMRAGRPVKGYSRWAPGARHEMAIFVVVGIVAVGMGNGGVGSGGDGGTDRSPRPERTAEYPVKFPDSGEKGRPEPKPSVSYPIRFSPQDGDQ